MCERRYLRDIRNCREMSRVSREINDSDGQIKLDCSGVYHLEEEMLKALFSGIREEWRRPQELERLFVVNSIAPGILRQIVDFPSRPSQPPRQPAVIGIIISLIIVFAFAIRTFPYFSKAKVDAKTLTIGTLWTPESQALLAEHLEENLVSRNYLEFIKGEKIRVIVDGDRTLPYQEARNRIANQNWDIAFAVSPIISIFAKDNGYVFVAPMFPDSDAYQSGIFVRRESPIQSLDDIEARHTIALGELARSASSFFMPVYDLYGKVLNVDYGNRGSEIRRLVKLGEVDLGAAAISSFGDAAEEDSEIRFIHQSRDIPGSGVYLSQKLSASDREVIMRLMLNAPEEIKRYENSNYDIGEEPNYDYFRDIIKRVNDILICSDFSKNPVSLFCPPGFEPTIMTGEVNGWSARHPSSVVLRVSQENGEGFNVDIPQRTLQQILQQTIGSSNFRKLQHRIVTTRTPMEPSRDENGILTVKVTQPTQFQIR